MRGLSPIEWFSLLARASALLSQAQREYDAPSIRTLKFVRIRCPSDDTPCERDAGREETSVFVRGCLTVRIEYDQPFGHKKMSVFSSADQ